MFDVLYALPMAFWIVASLIIAGCIWALGRIREGIGLPMLAVLVTVAVWYLGDALYNDYTYKFMGTFSPPALNAAWFEVAWFVIAFIWMAPKLHRRLNVDFLKRSSRLLHMAKVGVDEPAFQSQMTKLFYVSVFIWGILLIIATLRLQDQVVYYLFPILGEHADPWGRGRIGHGIDFLLSLASYFQILVASSFGIVAALLKRPYLSLVAVVLCFVTWPFFLLDRTRNVMLIVAIPGLTSFVFLRLRIRAIEKIIILAICFIIVYLWMAFVISHRTKGTISEAVHSDVQVSELGTVHQEGLNMFEELCWINTFIQGGTYKVNWGEGYLGELLSAIPRSLWPDKPAIGFEYALARGMGASNAADASEGGIVASVSTGMIGGGVVNFGPFLGPLAAALLMSLWVTILARLDLDGDKIGRIPLCALGLLLTFNLGRDITFLTLYTFIFGAALIAVVERFASGKSRAKQFPSIT